MRTSSLAALSGALLSITTLPAVADILVIELNHEYSGAASPAGSAPWARATFTDKGGGVVGLMLECLLQDSNEFMAKAAGGGTNRKGWFFNIDPNLDAGDLAFSHLNGTGASGIHTANDAYKAGPDKFYDIVLQFGTGLVGGQTAEFDITVAGGGLLASSFDYITTNGPAGKTGFHSAAHVQGIGNPSSGAGSSGWVGGTGTSQVIPLPSAGLMGLAGFALVAGRRRRAMI